ncbi:signal peptidase I [Actinomadura alba]|uniref:Signal peptidase I n=1 Tax=Actinomadura alba TaxID=406431 RepID=A0ABR7LV64_9ACTN|nr:signal peptidase I [Actinomadura alba]MBC6468669.1 signal peptidase I [Actinomadura alba]
MSTRLIAVMALFWLVAGCGVVNSAVHGYHRYTDPSVAMAPTIKQGQTFDARPVSDGRYTPRRGEIVVFMMPSWDGGRGKPFVKRVIAIGGDRIGCCTTGGSFTLNGTALSEPYLSPGTRAAEQPFGPVTVPAGRMWVMGDNRLASADSRFHISDADHGTIPAAGVIAIAVLK